MPHHLEPSRTTKAAEVLTRTGHPMTLEELAMSIGVTPAKLRSTLTNFDSHIVRVGNKLFDLGDRTYKGRTFRYTPTEREIKIGAIENHQDITYLLDGFRGFWNDIHLTDSNDNTATLIREKGKNRKYYRGLLPLLKNNPTKQGDDWLFTCQDLSTHTYSFRVQKRSDRDEVKIKKNNKKLADMVYSILSHAFTRTDTDMFLIRKYAFLFDGFNDHAPDSIANAIKSDHRFLHTFRDILCGWTGKPFHDSDVLTVAIKKYYYLADDSTYVRVNVQEDEWGDRVGWCTRCDSFLLWSSVTGWRHPTNELDRINASLPPKFFKIY